MLGYVLKYVREVISEFIITTELNKLFNRTDKASTKMFFILLLF